MITELLGITPYPALSALLWLGTLVALLYLARSSGHKLILVLSRTLHGAMTHAARSARSESRSVRGEPRSVRGELRSVRGELRSVRSELRSVRGEQRRTTNQQSFRGSTELTTNERGPAR